jgi:hypothetical protein
MKSIRKLNRMGSTVLPDRRRLNFRSANELIARRKRLRHRIAAVLAIVVGAGALLLEL